MSKKYKKNRPSYSLAVLAPVKVAWPFLSAIIFFFVVCLSTVDTAKGTAIVCVIAAIIAVLVRFSRLRERFTLPLVALALFVLMNGVSTFYAVSGKFALQEFLKLLISFCLMLLLLAATPGKGAVPGRRIAAILERCAALMGLVSIDYISTRWISTPVFGILKLLGADYRAASGVETGVRMTSMFDTPNVFAGCVGLGVLLSLGLALSSEGKKERAVHVVCLYINALAFVLAFSMGASAFIALAFVVYLLLESKERRASLFVLMVEALILTVLGAALVSMTSFAEWDGFRPVPLLCAVVGAAALCLLDRFVGQQVAEKLKKHGKALVIFVVAVLVAVAAYALAAFNLTGGITLQEGEALRRAVYPEPGSYTLTAQVDGPVSVTIESQNRQETMMHTSTVLYQGELSEAVFTVPEDSLVVYFNFAAGQSVSMEHIEYAGNGGAGAVPLGYKLLPGFIANRLQGLFANQNAIQRLVFFEDGLKLFHRSPVIGLGQGSYESALLSVQSFFYETKHAHNHYIQVLVEIGVIGLVLFVGLLLICGAAVWLNRRKKEETHPLTPALGAALVFMAGHAAMEVTFSNYTFLPLAFGVFGLIGLCCGASIPAAWLGKKVKSCVLAVICLLIVVFFVFLCENVSAHSAVERMPSFENFANAAKRDKFEWANHMLSYVMNLDQAGGDPAILAQGEEFAQRLAQVDSNVIPLYLSQHYFGQGDTEQGFALLEKFVSYVSSDSEAWETAFAVLDQYAQDTPEYRTGVSRLAQMMTDWDEANIGTITLSEYAQAFLESMTQ